MDAPHTVPHFEKQRPSPDSSTSPKYHHVSHPPAALKHSPAVTASSSVPADFEAGTSARLGGAVGDTTAGTETGTDPPEGDLQLLSLDAEGFMEEGVESTGHAGSSSCPQPRRAWLLPPELYVYGTAPGEQCWARVYS